MASRVATAVGRMYRVGRGVASADGGPLFPSVTSVLGVLDKPALLPWSLRIALDSVRSEHASAMSSGAAKMDDAWLAAALEKAARAPDAIKNSAASFGTRAHSEINGIITGQELPSDPTLAGVVAAFRQWYAGCGISLHPAGDTVVYSRQYQYAGAADAIGHRTSDGAIVVVDFKTSKFVHDSYALQLAAYAYAVREMAAAGELAAALGTSPQGSAADVSTVSETQPRVTPARRGSADPVVDDDLVMGTTRSMLAAAAAAAKFSSNAAAPLPLSTSPPLAPTVPSSATTGAVAGLLDWPLEALVVRLDRATGRVHVSRVPDLQAAFAAFRACLLLWHMMNSTGRAPLLEAVAEVAAPAPS